MLCVSVNPQGPTGCGSRACHTLTVAARRAPRRLWTRDSVRCLDVCATGSKAGSRAKWCKYKISTSPEVSAVG